MKESKLDEKRNNKKVKIDTISTAQWGTSGFQFASNLRVKKRKSKASMISITQKVNYERCLYSR